MAEWSKAVVSGTILFGGVGSNPTPCILIKKKTISRERKKRKEYKKTLCI